MKLFWKLLILLPPLLTQSGACGDAKVHRVHSQQPATLSQLALSGCSGLLLASACSATLP
jgi:hypothetical protein